MDACGAAKENKVNEGKQDSVDPQSTDNLASDVIRFSSNLPYWAKFLSERILRTGATTSEDLASSYKYLLEELGIATATNTPTNGQSQKT